MSQLIKLCPKCGQEKQFTLSDSMCCECRSIVNRRNNKPKQNGWHSWHQMLSRCYYENHPSFENYGGRGIKVCKRWESFKNFIEDMGPRPGKEYSIERLENDGNYTKSNCVWATNQVQSRNKRNNVSLEYRGKIWLLCDLAKEKNIHQKLLGTRLRQGMNLEDALQPVNYKSKDKLKQYA